MKALPRLQYALASPTLKKCMNYICNYVKLIVVVEVVEVELVEVEEEVKEEEEVMKEEEEEEVVVK